jgi:hypothetical protein
MWYTPRFPLNVNSPKRAIWLRNGVLWQHADLNSPETAAAGKNESRPLVGMGHNLSLPICALSDAI